MSYYEDEFRPEIGPIGEMGEAGNIPTIYKFVEFRSRLEARWAIFFDGIGAEWEYEPEQFSLRGFRYTPDFSIATDGFDAGYFEVKPRKINTGELEKVIQFVLVTGNFITVADQSMENPGAWWWDGLRQYRYRIGHPGTSQGPYVYDEEVGWHECPECGSIELAGEGLISSDATHGKNLNCSLERKRILLPCGTPRILAAAKKARTTRLGL